MPCRVPLLALPALLLLAAAAPAQAPDPAELLPAHTLAYLEVTQPAQVSQTVAELLKGTALDNLPAVFADFRQKAGKDGFFWENDMAMWGTFFSPEGIAEAGRLRGAAVAVTGLAPDGQPEVVGVILSGDSHLPGFIARAVLTSETNMRSVAEVEGTRVYRALRRDFEMVAGPKGNPAPPAPRPLVYQGPAIALTRDMVILASTPELVGDVLRRARGKGVGPTLAGVPGFQEADTLRRRPGLFGYADLAAGLAAIEKTDTDGLVQALPGWQVMHDLLGIKGLRTAAASVTLQDGAADFQVQLNLDPAHRSRLLELVLDQPANPALLHAVPRDALFALTLSLPDGERRWGQLVALADEVARSAGGPEALRPGQVLAGLEAKLDLRFGKDVLAKVNGLGLIMPDRVEIAKGGTRLPMLVFSTTDATAAESLLPVLTRLVGLAQEEVPVPTSERIQGQRVYSLPGRGLPLRTQVHYGQQGAILVVGQDRKLVGEALAAAQAGEGLGKLPGIAERARGKVLVAAGHVGPTLAELIRGQATTANKAAQAGNEAHRHDARNDPEARAANDRQLAAAFAQTTDQLPPWTLTLDRKPGRLTLHWRQDGLKAAAAAVVDPLIQWSLRDAQLRSRFGTFEFVGEKVAPAAK
jgi:hypothetical protein